MSVNLKSVKTRLSDAIGWLARKRLLGVTFIGTSIVLAAGIIATAPTAKPQPITEKAWPVSVVTASPKSLAPVMTVYGKVESRQMAVLKTSVTAPVAQVITPEGTWVEKGDLMVLLDSTELDLSVRSADADYKRRLAVLAAAKNDYAADKKMMAHYRTLANIANAKLKRNHKLYKTRMISDAIFDQVRQQADEAAITLQQQLAKLANYPSIIDQDEAMVAEGKAILDKAKLDLDQARMRAPFSGRVIQVMVAPGDRVQPGVPVIQVADYGQLEFRAPIPADTGYALRASVRNGAKVTAVATVDGHKIDCVLDRLSGDVKLGQSGVDVFFSPVSPVSLDIGRVVGLTITLPTEQDVVALPVQSIYQGGRVYKVEKHRLVGINVQQVGEYMDPDNNYRILVKSPRIHKGDTLVTSQLPRAITGLLVDPIEATSLDSAIAGQGNHVPDTGS